MSAKIARSSIGLYSCFQKRTLNVIWKGVDETAYFVVKEEDYDRELDAR